jgi:hypothetical protein
MDMHDWTDDQVPLINVQFPNPKAFLRTLSVVKPPSSSKQTAIVEFTAQGLGINWENDSKTMQSGISMGASLFSMYDLLQNTSFGVPFDLFFNTLAAMVSIDNQGSALSLKYPGPNAEVLLECSAPSEMCSIAIHTHARINTSESTHFTSFNSVMSDNRSSFISESKLIQEVFNDLEWCKSSLTITMLTDPWTLSFSSQDGRRGKALAINIPLQPLCVRSASFNIQRVCRKYRTKNLRSAFQNLSFSNEVCEVVIDEHGILSITHILSIEKVAGGDASGGTAVHPLASYTSQDTSGPEELTVAQFVLLPLCDDDDDDDDDQRVKWEQLGGDDM